MLYIFVKLYDTTQSSVKFLCFGGFYQKKKKVKREKRVDYHSFVFITCNLRHFGFLSSQIKNYRNGKEHIHVNT